MESWCLAFLGQVALCIALLQVMRGYTSQYSCQLYN